MCAHTVHIHYRCVNTWIYTCMHACMHARKHTHTHSCTHAHRHTHTHTHTHSHTHTLTHSHTHTLTHSHTHTLTHSHTHTHTHTHTCVLAVLSVEGTQTNRLAGCPNDVRVVPWQLLVSWHVFLLKTAPEPRHSVVCILDWCLFARMFCRCFVVLLQLRPV